MRTKVKFNFLEKNRDQKEDIIFIYFRSDERSQSSFVNVTYKLSIQLYMNTIVKFKFKNDCILKIEFVQYEFNS